MKMAKNLLKPEWAELDSNDLRLLLDIRIGGPGQYTGTEGDNYRLFLPLADDTSRIALRFKGNQISAIESAKSFDPAEWRRLSAEIESKFLAGPHMTGRDISFSSFRVDGWWRGRQSGVQIRRLPKYSPSVPVEMGAHPFILEFPMRVTPEHRITNERRRREHRDLTLLLNVLLKGHTTIPSLQSEHVWAFIGSRRNQPIVKWVQRAYFAKIGKMLQPKLSRPVGDPLTEVEPSIYYEERGHDGKGLRVPADLDESIVLYKNLTKENRRKFDRALFWLNLASNQWTESMSASFASLVSAIESLTDRGKTHSLYCRKCKVHRHHDVPGPTSMFREFFETYAPGKSLRKRRDEMYQLRSSILHGSNLISFDEGRAHGWDPPWRNQNELHSECWVLTRIALRNWLKSPPAEKSQN